MAMAAFKPATGNGKITHTIHTDHLGGTNVITDQGGEVSEVTDYYPYGALRIDDQAGSFTEQRKYIGEEYDAGVGLNYLNARHYDGARGQFLSQDPAHLYVGDPTFMQRFGGRKLETHLSDPQQLNSYNYARNNPLLHKDPSGRLTIDISGGYSRGFFGGDVGVRIELFSGWGIQTYYSTSLGPQIGASLQLKIDPTGTLVPAGDYVSREAMAAYYGGISFSTDAEFNPYNPLSLKGNPRSSFGVVGAIGPAGGYTHQFVKMGQPSYFFGNNTIAKDSSSGAPMVYDSSGNQAKVGNQGSGGFNGIYDFGPDLGKYDYGKQEWVDSSTASN